ncbi:dephospho-CoA kinase [Clostridium sp. MT-14]|uniref:Dephospho-CoA kinase n=1 Tax=Clostridium aromativorans TaxID=2836848 RepID=A0ABS8N9V7_9CLOT|nr:MULTISPECIES: dephospho-CoA kinase [Clostridium]KAA8669108.1 dephospho-CoA kinase [Clostridium sp. HV4-5-A1G]MCC9295949.1 dephospho-CoA kinase [Clostridium aromativorans]CAB1251367.1 dephosphocoenzyme A kinase [Clostridiaceae bacterium BL-3]
MIKIGLTGGIGSGKSTVSSMLLERGIKIIDADDIARNVIEKYPAIMDDIKLIFGERYIDSSKKLKRKEFGNYIFSHECERVKYENIIIPFIKREILNNMNKLEKDNEKICIVDGATLIENQFHKNLDLVLLVWVNKRVQIQRVEKRDKLTEPQVIQRINSQMSLEEKKKYADFILDNSGTLENTRRQLEKIFSKLNIKF